MADNYLLRHLDSYFEELSIINGNLFLTISLLNAKTEEILGEERIYGTIVQHSLPYDDLSLERKTRVSKYVYQITVDTVEEKMKDVISQHNSYTISQSYEVFESFLIDIITEVTFQNPDKLSVVAPKFKDCSLTKEAIRSIVKDSSGVNNKRLLSVIRKLAPALSKYEKTRSFSLPFGLICCP